MSKLAERRIAQQHDRDDHRDCDRTTCRWWLMPIWVRKAQAGKLVAKVTSELL
jgi:hypothetical protein